MDDPQPGGSGLGRTGAPSVSGLSRASSRVDSVRGGVISIHTSDDEDEDQRDSDLSSDEEFDIHPTVRRKIIVDDDSDADDNPKVLSSADMRKAEDKKRRREQAGQTTNVRRQKKTPLWQHYKLAKYKKPRKSSRGKLYHDAVCQVVVVDTAHPEGKKCGAFLARVDGATGGMRGHLHSKHGEVYSK